MIPKTLSFAILAFTSSSLWFFSMPLVAHAANSFLPTEFAQDTNVPTSLTWNSPAKVVCIYDPSGNWDSTGLSCSPLTNYSSDGTLQDGVNLGKIPWYRGSGSQWTNQNITGTWHAIFRNNTVADWGSVYNGNYTAALADDAFVASFTFTVHGTGWTANTATRIDSVTPVNGAVVATTTPTGGVVSLNATGYFNIAQDPTNIVGTHLGGRIKWNAYSLSQAAIGNCIDVICAFLPQNTGYTSYSGELYGSSAISVSSSSPVLPYGRYTLTTSLVVPNQIFGIPTWGETTVVSTTTSFYFGTSTPKDNLIYGTNGSPDLATALSGGIIATTSAAFYSSCNPSLSFSVGDCFALIFYPDWSQLTTVFVSLREGLLSVVPWGYLTRTLTIASGNATSTLPSLIIDFSHAPPAEAGLASGAVLNLTPWSDLLGTTSMLSMATSTYSGKTFRQIVEPGWDMFVILIFVFLVFHEFLGVKSNQPEHKKL
ncbi:hypothetical protein [Thiobacillus sp.]